MYPSGRRKDGGVEVVSSLVGLFDSEEEEEAEYEHEFHVQELQICGRTYQIRQFRWHEANANQVWPGTFALSEYMSKNIERYKEGLILELGAATGALALHLCAQFDCSVVTSDIVDDGVVEKNIKYNFELNNQASVQHIPHTWGERWPEDQAAASSFHKIIASDILLYVKSYPALVKTLRYLFDGGSVTEFLMSWNRRLSTTPIFFQLMKDAGFVVQNLPNCLYIFTAWAEPKVNAVPREKEGA
jgi:predicted nicotinamide N-methyase